MLLQESEVKGRDWIGGWMDRSDGEAADISEAGRRGQAESRDRVAVTRILV